MTFSLTPELEQLVQQKVESGLYPSASEVIHAALRLLEERDRARQARRNRLREEIAIGIEQIDRGEYTSYDEHSLGTLVDRVRSEGRKKLTPGEGASEG